MSDSVSTFSNPTDRPKTVAEVPIRAFERSLPMALLRAREAVMAHFRPILTTHDLTEQQWRVLRALEAIPGSMSVGALAEETFLLGPSLSRMLVVLERRGLIVKTVSNLDARRFEVSISSQGLELVAEIAPHSEAAYKQIEASFGPGELDQLFALLEQTDPRRRGDAQ